MQDDLPTSRYVRESLLNSLIELLPQRRAVVYTGFLKLVFSFQISMKSEQVIYVDGYKREKGKKKTEERDWRQTKWSLTWFVSTGSAVHVIHLTDVIASFSFSSQPAQLSIVSPLNFIRMLSSVPNSYYPLLPGMSCSLFSLSEFFTNTNSSWRLSYPFSPD